MNTREAKALELADRGRVIRNGDKWFVFSLNGPEKYEVTLEPVFCTCEDFETTHEAGFVAQLGKMVIWRN